MDFRLENEYGHKFDEYLKTNPSKDDFENMCWDVYMGGQDDDQDLEEYSSLIQQYVNNHFS